MQAKNLLSAANVDIVLSISTPGGGKPQDVVIGYLQDLSATAAYHMQPIRTIYNPLVSSFVAGIKECRGTARRAFIEWDNTLGLLQMVSEMASDLGQVNSVIRSMNTQGPVSLATAIAGVQGLNGLSGVVSGVQAMQKNGVNLNLISNLNKNQFSIGDILSQVAFDLLITTPSIDSTSNQLTSQPIWRLKGCYLDARTVSIAIGNVVVLEEIVFVFTDFMEEHWNTNNNLYWGSYLVKQAENLL